MKSRKGISLIVLVITIIVIIILCSAIVFYSSTNDIYSSTKETAFKMRLKEYESKLKTTISNNLIVNPKLKIKDVSAQNDDEVKKYINNINKDDENKLKIIEGELVFLTDNTQEINWANEIGIIAGEDAIYLDELKRLQTHTETWISLGNEKIGEELTDENYVEIRGFKYGYEWYKLSEEETKQMGVETLYSPYILNYRTGVLMNIAGRVINGTPIHSLNYSDDMTQIVKEGLLAGADPTSTQSALKWGELTLKPSSTYDSENGLVLNGNIGLLPVDQSRPINQQYSVIFTVKGETTNQMSAPKNYCATIIAISDNVNQYLCWIGIHKGYLHVYSYRGSPYSNVTTEKTEKGFTSIDINEYDNEFLNVQVTAKKGETTQVYINGSLRCEFESGDQDYTYKTLTLGDLREGRNLKYKGSIYNIALYSTILTKDQIIQNWSYTKNLLNIQ